MSRTSHRIESRQLSDLKPAPYNPRHISEPNAAALRNGIRRFGMVQPVVWNERTGHIVGGHARVEALRQLGEKTVDVVVVDLDDDRERELNVQLNNPNAQGEFDKGQLLDLLNDMSTATLDDLRLSELIPGERNEPELREWDASELQVQSVLYVTCPMEKVIEVMRLLGSVEGVQVADEHRFG